MRLVAILLLGISSTLLLAESAVPVPDPWDFQPGPRPTPATPAATAAPGDGGLLQGGLLEGDLLASPTPAAPAQAAPAATPQPPPIDAAGRAHLALFAESRYPSANTCATCHPRQFEQWSVSQHAYAQLSPIYLAMQNTINARTSSTNGDFCIRCHNQVGMNMGESPFASNLDRHPTSREGITCVVCHRMSQPYGKVSGRIGLEEGDITQPVKGPKGNAELARVLDKPGQYRVVTDPEASGRKVHAKVGHFPYLGESGFCGTCHDVNLFNGFRLEEAFSDYKQSPAARDEISCQDCHMGTVQGRPDGYAHGPAAEVGGEPTQPRRLTNHFFAGPDYSVIHPGLFPHNPAASKLGTMREWLEFDVAAGWGTDAFEDSPQADSTDFPTRWAAIDDRYDARAIIADQQARLDWAAEQRLTVLRNALELGQIDLQDADADGLRFAVTVHNRTPGHSVPTGFDAERVIWLQVQLRDADHNVLWRSGDLDPNGDLRDSHSLYVQAGKLPRDKQLFSLQSRFVTRLLRGGERERVLAVNTSQDPLPFIRPSTRSTVLTGQPASARKHRFVIPPLGEREARYTVPGPRLNGNGPYLLDVTLRAGMVPVNLIHDIQDVGFDYGMSPRAVADAVVAGHQTIAHRQALVSLDEQQRAAR